MNVSYKPDIESTWSNLFINEELIDNHGVLFVLVLSGFFGIVLGLAHSTWNVVAESAQVVAGIVKYPGDNPFYIYHVKVWTVLHQFGALVLLCGFSEETLSMILSGFSAMLSFQALSLFTFFLCRNLLVSLATPFFMQFTQVMDFGINYPVQIVGYPHAYGVVGLALSVLIISFFCLRQYRAGGALLGIMPAFHITTAFFLSVVLLVAFLSDFKRFRPYFITAFKYFLMGCLVSGISLAIHLLFTYDVPKVDSETTRKYLDVIIRYWDPHRMPVNFVSVNFYLCILSPVICWMLLTFGRDNIPTHFVFPLRVLLITGVIGGLACVATHIPPEFLNPGISRLMPTRLLNINVVTLLPLFIGVMLFYKNDFSLQLNLALLLIALGLLLSLHPDHWGRMLMFVFTVSALFMVLSVLKTDQGLTTVKPWPVNAAMMVLIIIMFVEGVKGFSSWSEHESRFQSWRNDPMFARIHAGESVLLVGPHILGFVQLQVSRPVFLSMPFNAMPYVPEAGPSLDRMLKGVYGVDLFNPSEESRRERDLPRAEVKELWEARTLEQWQAIKAHYALTDIFTYANWNLQLPVAHPPEWKSISGGVRGQYIVYHIP